MFFFKIKSKNGKHLGDISEFNGKFAKPNQKEVIFDKSTKFKMVDYFEKDGVFYFEMVEL